MEEERLKILRSLMTGITVTNVPDSHAARKLFHFCFVEYLGHESVSFDTMELTFCIHGHNATTLLASMLQGMQTIIC